MINYEKWISKKQTYRTKAQIDYKSEEFLSQVETYAKKGFTDREIAFALGLAPQTFCEKKNEHSELCEVLARGRATITAAVRAKFLAVALGGIKTKSTVVRKLKDQWRKPDRRRRASGKWKRAGSQPSGNVCLAISSRRWMEEGWTPSGRRRRYSKGY